MYAFLPPLWPSRGYSKEKRKRGEKKGKKKKWNAPTGWRRLERGGKKTERNGT